MRKLLKSQLRLSPNKLQQRSALPPSPKLTQKPQQRRHQLPSYRSSPLPASQSRRHQQRRPQRKPRNPSLSRRPQPRRRSLPSRPQQKLLSYKSLRPKSRIPQSFKPKNLSQKLRNQNIRTKSQLSLSPLSSRPLNSLISPCRSQNRSQSKLLRRLKSRHPRPLLSKNTSSLSHSQNQQPKPMSLKSMRSNLWRMLKQCKLMRRSLVSTRPKSSPPRRKQNVERQLTRLF